MASTLASPVALLDSTSVRSPKLVTAEIRTGDAPEVPRGTVAQVEMQRGSLAQAEAQRGSVAQAPDAATADTSLILTNANAKEGGKRVSLAQDLPTYFNAKWGQFETSVFLRPQSPSL
jgi:hypothetical protein